MVFLSDNVVALSHVRDFISREATTKNLQLSINASITSDVTVHLLRRLHPQLVDLVRQRQQRALSAALEETLTDQLASDGNADWMTAEFCNVHLTAKENQANFNGHHSVEDYQSI